MTVKTYTIGELAQEFDTTTRAIRFYEDQGLITPMREGQKRIYNPSDRITIKLIMRGKRLGFSLAESKELIELYNSGNNNQEQHSRVLEQVRISRERLLQQQADIEMMMLELDEHEARVRADIKKTTKQV
ncbi:MAG: MerR family DNA-binding transcriptional regulator [Oleispira sp.]|nr:MerR family DNA-binding transcriptional regulator [Oleispira sp.]